MKKSAVAGVAGSIRIDPLTLGGLAGQERHGKREDLTSQARVIRDVAPLITNGLNLKALYHRHVEGCFVPGGKTKVLHVLIQFPKDLVDLGDEAGLLHHALKISERIWGDKCVMAARYDRDERSQGVADVFVVPKYLKTTKADPEGKRAVAMTRHGKLLAEKWKRLTGKGKKGQPQATPWDVGRALQDELYDYLKNVMKLEGVQRGEEKQVVGPDRKSSEELRDEEIAEKTRELDLRAEAQDKRDKDFEATRLEAERLRDHALLIMDKIPEWKREAREGGYEEGFASGKADAEAQNKERLEAERQAQENQLMLQRKKDEEAAQKIRDDLETLRTEALNERKSAKNERDRAQEERRAVEAGLEAIARGDILSGRPGANPDKHLIVFRAELNEEAKQSLRSEVAPVWNWLSQQAERIASIVSKRIADQEKRLARKASDLDRQVAKNGAKQLKLEQLEAKLSTLIEQARILWTSFKTGLEPITSFQEKFEAAGAQIKQVLAKGPRAEIVREALSDPKVKEARDAGEEFGVLASAFEKLQRELKGKG